MKIASLPPAAWRSRLLNGQAIAISFLLASCKADGPLNPQWPIASTLPTDF